MGDTLKYAPAYLTLSQVRFNPVLKLIKFLPDIQENFRQAGYPDFEQQRQISIQVTVVDGQQKPNLVTQDRYVFGNLDRTHDFVLDGQSLTLQSTNYGNFEAFSDCFLNGLRIVDDAVKLAYVERIGLRYLDRVMPRASESLELYLAKQVHGLTSKLGGKSLHTFTEAFNEVGSTKLLSRVAIQDGPLSFPPDLQLRRMAIAEQFVLFSGTSAILDNDGFIELREVFDTSKIGVQLDEIHKVLGAAFRATATSHAFSIWESRA